ncbi:MAG TPA: hypothetical protein VJJ23_03890 [Candidatus Nanoarchaeia archaeon]|nr:hypothetical protein [Candidatus Nanoarchaeia archaeon]
MKTITREDIQKELEKKLKREVIIKEIKETLDLCDNVAKSMPLTEQGYEQLITHGDYRAFIKPSKNGNVENEVYVFLYHWAELG